MIDRRWERDNMRNDALETARKWFECVNSGDLEQVVALYDANATFHPTLSSKFIRDATSTKSYFSQFLSKQPRISLLTHVAQQVSNDAFLFTGIMQIAMIDSEIRSTIDARCTFVWQYVGGHWRIIHHHNSTSPKQNRISIQHTS